MAKTVAVIDGNSLMHRAYHAIPPTMNAPDGTPTNAVFGFFAMLLKFIETQNPDAVVCAFDAGKPTFRIAELEQYKAQRPPMDEELREQFPIVEDLLGSLNIPVIKMKGWEGDDILGTIAARDEELGYRSLLVTGDKDACQLASDLTSIVTTKKGITDVMVYGPAEVKERYGVTPEQFPDFLGLMGDSSDNIPGVPGIGAKTAAKLLDSYGSIEGIYAAIDELKGKQKENLVNNESMAYLSRDIATIVRDLDFTLDLEAVAFPEFSVEAATDTFGKYALTAHLARFLALIGETPQEAEPVAIEPGPLKKDQAALDLLDQALSQGEMLGIAYSLGAQASLFESSATVAFSSSEGVALLEGNGALEGLAQVVKNGSFVALSGKELVHLVYPADTAKEAYVTLEDLMAMDLFDAGLAGYVLDSSVSEYAVAGLLERFMGGALPTSEEEEGALALEACALRMLVEPLTQAMEQDGVIETYRRIDVPLVAVLDAMERTGVALDGVRLAEIGAKVQGDLDELSERIYELAGETFNIDSPKQLSSILFEKLGLPPIKKNSRGYSTDASVLKELAKTHELPGLVLTYRELAKLKSTYIDTLPRLRGDDGRIHTCFNETVTTTGRLSSSNPNLQNIPVRTDLGRKIRECFVPLDEDSLFLSADYSQIELRLLAHLSGDEHLIAAFNSGADFHAATAARVFGVAPEEVTPAMRSQAKAVNFGIVYGQQAFGLSQSLDIPFAEARTMIDRYFEAYPGVRRYLDTVVAEATENGWAQTMFGRKRHIPEIKARHPQQRGFGERTAMNHPMQGTAADIIKLAMIEVQRRLLAEHFEAKLIIQVHDELDFSVPSTEVERLAAMVKEVMESVVSLAVPLDVDVQWGNTWAEAH